MLQSRRAACDSPVMSSYCLNLQQESAATNLMCICRSQHIFVDSSNPASVWTSTYNCVGCPDNQKSFNDGYHIIHHLAPGLHWSQMPQRFIGSLQDHATYKGEFDAEILRFHKLKHRWTCRASVSPGTEEIKLSHHVAGMYFHWVHAGFSSLACIAIAFWK